MRGEVEAHSNPEELKNTCRDALDEAHRIGFAVPRLEALSEHFRSP
jgi:2-dehydropantoate 2-reductase